MAIWNKNVDLKREEFIFWMHAIVNLILLIEQFTSNEMRITAPLSKSTLCCSLCLSVGFYYLNFDSKCDEFIFWMHVMAIVSKIFLLERFTSNEMHIRIFLLHFMDHMECNAHWIWKRSRCTKIISNWNFDSLIHF